MTWKYRTALTLVVTLSLVMISCGGTSRVITRRSILTTLSTPNGMMKYRPGPFSPMRRPRRKTTPRSYSFAMRRLEKTTTRASSTMTPKTRRGPVSTLFLLLRFAVRLHGSGFARHDLESQPGAADDLDLRSRLDRLSRGRGRPQRAAHEHEALRRNVLPGLAGGANQRFGSGGHRRASSHPDAQHEKHEEAEADQAGQGDQHGVHAEPDWAGVDQEGEPEHERQDATRAEDAVRIGFHIGDEEPKGDDEHERAGDVHRQVGERDHRQHRGDAADHAGQDRARRRQLSDDSVGGEQEQKRGDRGVDERAEEDLPEGHWLRDHPSDRRRWRRWDARSRYWSLGPWPPRLRPARRTARPKLRAPRWGRRRR